MFLAASVFSLAAVLLSSLPPSQARPEPADDDRAGDDFRFMISGGNKHKEYTDIVKFMVSIRTRTPEKYFGDNHLCAGTIIRRSTVVTSAHCVMDRSKVLTRARQLLVVAGTSNRLRVDVTTYQYPVVSVRAHPHYVQRNTNDIAVIRIKGRIPDDNETIQRIKMPTKPPEWGSTCYTVGWGRMYFKGPLSALPLYIEVTLYEPDVCAQKTSIYKKNIGMLCASNDEDSYADPCRGDSGGPLICNGVFTGVISWTIGCGNTDIPSIFTDVYFNRRWIRGGSTRIRGVVVGIVMAAAFSLFH